MEFELFNIHTYSYSINSFSCKTCFNTIILCCVVNAYIGTFYCQYNFDMKTNLWMKPQRHQYNNAHIHINLSVNQKQLIYKHKKTQHVYSESFSQTQSLPAVWLRGHNTTPGITYNPPLNRLQQNNRPHHHHQHAWNNYLHTHKPVSNVWIY